MAIASGELAVTAIAGSPRPDCLVKVLSGGRMGYSCLASILGMEGLAEVSSSLFHCVDKAQQS